MDISDFCLAVDAGHGFGNKTAGTFDPGICSGGHCECDVTLAWALTIKFVFSAAGVRTYLTRTNNQEPMPVWKRDDLAAAHGATHFLSIHTNGYNGKATGVETFIRDKGDRGWGAIVQACVVSATGLVSRGVKLDSESQHHGGLAVLDFDGPGCLVEVGFLDHLADRNIIVKKETRALFAQRLLSTVQKNILYAATA
jgi:N-acetylmuramoyl-L-alanine amidase